MGEAPDVGKRQPHRAAEMQWPDYVPLYATQLYSDVTRQLFGTEWAARVRRSKTGEPQLLPLEQIQIAITQATNPEASLKYKNGRGPLTRSLDAEVGTHVLDGKKRSRIGTQLQIPGTQGLIDEALCNVLIVGCVAKRKKQGLSCEDADIRAEMSEALTRAVTTIKKIATDPVFTSFGFTDTNWRSFFEQLVRAHMFESYQPTLITSVGATAEDPSVAAAVNILPVLKLAQTLRASGYKPKVIGSFASEFAIACNGEDANGTRRNQHITQALYEAVAKKFFPEVAADSLSFETPAVSALEEKLPAEYIAFVKRVMREPESISPEFKSLCDSLLGTAANRANHDAAGEEAFNKAVDYLLSHQLIFRDIQKDEFHPSVIKVGNPGELRFSRFQQITTEAFMNSMGKPKYLIPNATHHVTEKGADSKWDYGQITLYYPKIGERPPYFSEKGDDNESVFSLQQNTFFDWKGDRTSTLERYAALEKTLKQLGVDPDAYIQTVKETASAFSTK